MLRELEAKIQMNITLVTPVLPYFSFRAYNCLHVPTYMYLIDPN